MSIVHPPHAFEEFRSVLDKLRRRLDPAVARLVAAGGFLLFLVAARPSALGALESGLLAVFFAATFSARAETEENASAIIIEAHAFAALDGHYGEGSARIAFGLLRQAMEAEAHNDDLVVQMDGTELVLLTDRLPESEVRAVLARIERRFSHTIRDAGYDCDLDIGLAGDPLRTNAKRARTATFRRVLSTN